MFTVLPHFLEHVLFRGESEISVCMAQIAARQRKGKQIITGKCMAQDSQTPGKSKTYTDTCMAQTDKTPNE